MKNYINAKNNTVVLDVELFKALWDNTHALEEFSTEEAWEAVEELEDLRAELGPYGPAAYDNDDE